MEMAVTGIDLRLRIGIPNVDAAMRRLAAARVLEEVQGCLDKPMGMPYLEAWFQSDGKEWLDLAGMGHLLEVPAAELAQRVFQFAPDLITAQRCIYCTHLEYVGDNRVQCGLGVWEDQGMKQDYAVATVRHSSKRFPGCDKFEEGEAE